MSNKMFDNKLTEEEFLEIAKNKKYLTDEKTKEIIIEIILKYARSYSYYYQIQKKTIEKFIELTIISGDSYFFNIIINENYVLNFLNSTHICERFSLIEIINKINLAPANICDLYLQLTINRTIGRELIASGNQFTQLPEIKNLLIKLKYILSDTQIFLLLISATNENRAKLITEFNIQITTQFVEKILNFEILYTSLYRMYRNAYQFFLSCFTDLIVCFLNYKIIPSEQLVNNVIYMLCCMNGMNGCYKCDSINIILKNETICCNIIDVTSIFTVLLSYGYILTEKQALLLTGHNIYISNIEDYGININQDKFYELIFRNYGVMYKDKLKPSLVMLQYKLLKQMSIAELRQLTAIIKPDKKCLLHAIIHNPIIIVKHLVEECNVQPNLEMLRKAVASRSDSITDFITDKICNLYKNIKLEEEETKLYEPVIKKKPNKKGKKVVEIDDI